MLISPPKSSAATAFAFFINPFSPLLLSIVAEKKKYTYMFTIFFLKVGGESVIMKKTLYDIELNGQRFIMKKIYTKIFLAAVILLPACFAVFSFMNAQTQPVQTSSVTAMELIAPDGSSVRFDAQTKADSEFIRFFIDLNNNARNVEKLPSDLEDAACYTARYVSHSSTREYRYYFSPTKPSNSYYQDYDGNAYRIDAADTITFLDSKYSGALYDHSQAPKLTVIGVEESDTDLDAVSSEWHYYTYSNVEHSVQKENALQQTFTASYASFGIRFDIFPSESSLSITNDAGEVVYSGSYTDFIAEKHLKDLIRQDTLLHFDLSATWEADPAMGYGGSADYRFDLNVVFDPGAVFWLGEETIELGDFVVLSGQYVENLDELTFSSTPDIGLQPQFFTDGEYVRALIPLSQMLSAGDYEFTLNYMGIPKTLTLKVKSTAYADTIKNYRYTGLRTYPRTAEALAEFEQYIASLPYEEAPLFNGTFLLNTGANLRAQFGNTINNTDDRSDRFLSNGAAIVAYAGTQIYAVNNGKVIAVGTTAYGGNTVVVDHGLGLRSVYYCIGKVAVAVGDPVTTGSVIGSGACYDGYTDGITAYCELWVGDTPVSYYPLIESGRTGMIVYGEPTV